MRKTNHMSPVGSLRGILLRCPYEIAPNSMSIYTSDQFQAPIESKNCGLRRTMVAIAPKLTRKQFWVVEIAQNKPYVTTFSLKGDLTGVSVQNYTYLHEYLYF